MSELENLIWMLPGEVVGSIVTGNLILQDICRLEVACSSHKVRQLYLDAMCSHGRLDEVTAESSVLCWILKRRLKVGTVKVEPLNDYGELASIIRAPKLFQTLHVRLRSNKPSELHHAFLLLCQIEQKVSSIFVGQVPADDRFFRKPIFCGLATFHAELHNHSSEWVANVINHNTRLQTVNVIAQEPPFEGFFAALWARRSSLKTLSLGVAYPEAGTLIEQIAASCPAIQSLTIGMTGRLMGSCVASGIASLAGGCTDLRELKLSNCVMSNDGANQAVLRCLKNLCVLESSSMLLSDALLMTLAECRNDAPYLTELAILWNLQRTATVTGRGGARQSAPPRAEHYLPVAAY
jgi:hypothetical protein